MSKAAFEHALDRMEKPESKEPSDRQVKAESDASQFPWWPMPVQMFGDSANLDSTREMMTLGWMTMWRWMIFPWQFFMMPLPPMSLMAGAGDHATANNTPEHPGKKIRDIKDRSR